MGEKIVDLFDVRVLDGYVMRDCLALNLNCSIRALCRIADNVINGTELYHKYYEDMLSLCHVVSFLRCIDVLTDNGYAKIDNKINGIMKKVDKYMEDKLDDIKW